MSARIFNVMKMSWMLTWRLVVWSLVLFVGPNFGIILPTAIGISAVSVFVFNRTLLTWPLWKLIRGKRPIDRANYWGEPYKAPENVQPSRHRTAQPKPASAPQVEIEYVGSATEVGRITGFEPDALKDVRVPILNMSGVPGGGLKSQGPTNSYGSMSDEAVAAGKLGEMNFARALEKSLLIHRFHAVWSIPVPDLERFVPASYDADIDCALATGNTIYLVDLKNYKSGNVRYHIREDVKADWLYCEDIPTGRQVGEVKTMSINMKTATFAMRKHFPGVNIVPVVVFMPTNKGEGIIDNVTWPGGVRAMNLSDFLAKLSSEPNFEWGLPHSGAFARMSALATSLANGRRAVRGER